jgi:hypothetical protein
MFNVQGGQTPAESFQGIWGVDISGSKEANDITGIIAELEMKGNDEDDEDDEPAESAEETAAAGSEDTAVEPQDEVVAEDDGGTTDD